MDPRTLSETRSLRSKKIRPRFSAYIGWKNEFGKCYAQALCSLSGLNPSQPASEVDSAGRLHQGFQQWVKQIDGEGAIALVDQSFEFPRTLLNWML